MTPEAIIEASACRLGIRPTRAPVESQMWEAWRDRVQQAEACERELKHADLLVGAKNRVNARALARKGIEVAIREANAYAV
jgi:hypothetical protein